MAEVDLVGLSYERGRKLLETRSSDILKKQGQFLTPPSIARYMAEQLGEINGKVRLLEPAIGSGVLACAVIERLISEGRIVDLWIDAYEIDPDLCAIAREMLEQACLKSGKGGIKVHWQVFQKDFVLACMPDAQPSLFSQGELNIAKFDLVISNPPYFKLNAQDARAKISSGRVNGHTNIYTLFMALSANMLARSGKACFIVPRSFCSGVYFSQFRRDLLKIVKPVSMHLFQSRDLIFKSDEILQENVIFSFERMLEPKEQRYWAGTVQISTSANEANLKENAISREVSFRHFLGRHEGQLFFRLPTGILDEQILDAVDRWNGTLEKYGFQVSTGRVVAFRSRHLLRDRASKTNNAAPLLWMQNVKPYEVHYPLGEFDKPQGIAMAEMALLIPKSNYVLLRRFSAKEEKRRLVSAPLLAKDFPFDHIGLENHLNFIYSIRGIMGEDEAYGLAALFNSAIVDRYFRIVNGNTQVNAAELRELPLPSIEVLRRIGERTGRLNTSNPDSVDEIVFSTLWQTKSIAGELPIIKETRITMGKIEQAQQILENLGLPPAQQNEMAALTLLVLAQITEKSPWKETSAIKLRVHDILAGIKKIYGRAYAENTRETVRRQVLHQFEQAGLVHRNIDEPDRPTNSGKTNYILTDLSVRTIQAFGTPKWESRMEEFRAQNGSLLEVYQRTREQNKVPLQVADGTIFRLSPGPHNRLQSLIVEEFGPNFAPGAQLLYLGDTASKILIFEKDTLSKLGIPVSNHGKLPDVVLYDRNKDWIFLIEAVASHGPVSPKRQAELEHLLKRCKAGKIYVTAFLDRKSFKKYAAEIAWETEVWIAEEPSHLIHFNGDKFGGPH